ncbi:MAG: radical SAM family heme chaperone HemW [Desulfurispora sp.]|uniref:radical SAM family heme chaperone HemW n=1 Tax=Desulfurispora sp. TaxID=3014275 RepID=UPI004049CEA5
MKNELALYIHVPFCLAKCHYCDFVSYTYSDEAAGRWAVAVKQELALWARLPVCSGRTLATIYIGGGTPSLLPAETLGSVLTAVRRNFAVYPAAEITLEANPGTVEPDKLTEWRRLGVNRLSVGVQSLEEKHLRFLGRRHTAQQAEETVQAARAAGFANIGVDLIYGIPGLGGREWADTLRRVMDWPVTHLSAYALTVEQDTPLGRLVAAGRVILPDEDEVADQYELLLEVVPAAGLKQYEIANFARPGHSCRHNLNYWLGGEYLGVGPAAWSYLAGHRFANPAEPADYMGLVASGTTSFHLAAPLEPREELVEALLMGLRLRRGIDLAAFQQRYGVDLLADYRPVISRYVRLGLLEMVGGFLRLTGRGLLLSNAVLRELV